MSGVMYKLHIKHIFNTSICLCNWHGITECIGSLNEMFTNNGVLRYHYWRNDFDIYVCHDVYGL